MKKRVAVLLAALLPAAFLAARAAGADKAGAPPNIVVIFIDDLGYADIGPFGATKQKTPRLDRMAREGMKFTSFYAAPVCSVSRAQLLTGCYGARVSVPGVYGPGSASGLNPAEFTVAERLKALGYATACVGKWHVGDQPPFLPTRQGFDRYLGIPYSNDMQKKPVGGAGTVVPLMRDDKVEELLSEEQQGRIVERYTEEAVRFIREKKDGPFFLYLPHTAVHTPIHPGEAFRGTSANGRFGDWVQEVDWSVGRVLDTLRELQLDEKTLVFFTSDNGPWLVKGADGGCALPLRGGKGSTWEGGVRVPTVARWPGRIPAGRVCDAVAGTIDLLPTLVALAGGQVPAEPVIDGRDISPLLLGKSTESPREAHYYFAGYNLQAVRQGPWKLAIATQPETMGKGAAGDAAKNPRLYNLDREIGERTDLSDRHPEIVARLQALAAKMSAEIGGSAPAARRPDGRVENPKTVYPSESSRPRARKDGPVRAAPAQPADLGRLKPGDAVASEAVPDIGGKAFTLSCTVETAQRDVVLVAHGGIAVGYALYLRGGRAVFAVRHGAGASLAEIVSPEAIPGTARLAATLAADGGMTLSVDGKAVASGRAPSLVPRQPAEEFCVGHDSGRPVVLNAGGARFEGRIADLKLTTP